jgi:lysophospholipase L1-like esterase
MRASRALRLAGMAILSRRGQMTGDSTAAMQRPLPPAAEIEANVRAATGKYFRRNLQTLLALARRAGAEPILITNPLNPAKAKGLGPYYDAVSAAVERNNRIIREVGNEEGVAVIDLHAGVAEERLFWDAAHANDAGMAETARVLYEQLLARVRRTSLLLAANGPGRGRTPLSNADRGVPKIGGRH